MGGSKGIVRATGTVTYGEPAAVLAAADATQFDRLKALFDELGVKYEVFAERVPTRMDVVIKPGEKWLVTDEGGGYIHFYAAFIFTDDGRFSGYAVAEWPSNM